MPQAWCYGVKEMPAIVGYLVQKKDPAMSPSNSSKSPVSPCCCQGLVWQPTNHLKYISTAQSASMSASSTVTSPSNHSPSYLSLISLSFGIFLIFRMA